MRTHVVLLALGTVLLAACEPAYWVERHELLAAQAGFPRGVRAVRDSDRTEVLLKPEALARATVEGHDPALRVRVTPPNHGRRAGATMLGLGLGLATLGLVFGIVVVEPPNGCHDEACWVAPMIGGSISGALGAAMLLAGGITLGASTHSSELR